MSEAIVYHFQQVDQELRFTDNKELFKGEGIISHRFYTYKSARLYAKEMAAKRGCEVVNFVGSTQGGSQTDT